MRGWQTAITVVAIFFAAAALWPWSPLSRIVCSIAAFLLITIVLTMRLRAHASTRGPSRSTVEDMQSRIERIRADRERRFGRH